MYLGVDVGGSKTLYALFTEDGQISSQHKIHTNQDYSLFLKDFQNVISTQFRDHQISHCCIAIPGSIDRANGIGLSFGNLKWKNVPIKNDISKILGNAPVFVEHDAALGGLSEAIDLKDSYRKVLYVTLGTGVGSAIVIDGKLNPDFSGNEAGQMVIEHDGQIRIWEDFASGRQLYEDHGKMASQIYENEIWQDFASKIALGLSPSLAILQPEVVVIGGGVGTYLERYDEPLRYELTKFENDLVKVPPIVKAKRPEEAVIYGCYDYIRQQISQ
jgi:predicted NBD/HSP70 family sugar kinase